MPFGGIARAARCRPRMTGAPSTIDEGAKPNCGMQFFEGIMFMQASPAHRVFHVLVKPVGPLCNLDCGYCFYLEKKNLYPGNTNWHMREEVLESHIRQYIEAQDGPTVHFGWQGGEPTLRGLPFFRTAMELQKKYAVGKRIENSLQTNGTLLDDDWGQFLAANGFLVGLSLDGPRDLHNRFRVHRGGRPSFEAVLRGLGILIKHGVQFNTLTVVHRRNAHHPLEVYRFLKECGSRFMQFIPVVERVTAGGCDRPEFVSPDTCEDAFVSEWSVRPDQYGKFLCAIFDAWVRRDVGRYYVQIFDTTLESWMGLQPSLCVFRQTCGDAMALEHNGDLFSCDHYVYPARRLGNIMETPMSILAASPGQRAFGMAKQGNLPRCCRECPWQFACNGECPKHRFLPAGDGERNLNYLCAGYKAFFGHVEPFMQFMREQLRAGQSPANVMHWARGEDLKAAGKEGIGRNAPCPCKSGRKFKRCCGEIRP